jgi:spore germination protein YaaH
MDMYRKQGVQSIGFWRLGQESSSVWTYLKLMSAGPLTGIAKSVK